MARAGSRSRRFWFDPRFAIGLSLIVASVAGTAAVVAASDRSVERLAVRDTLVPGEIATADDFIAVRVGLDGASDVYLSADDVGADGVVITRTIASGELVPTAAVGDPAGVEFASVVVAVDQLLATGVVAGATVDIWAAPAAEGGGFGAPVVIVPTATVARLIEEDSLVVGADSGSVEVLVPRDTIARLLEAIADDDAISIVPASVSVGE